MLLYCVPCNEEFYSLTSSQITMTNLDFEYYSNSSCEPCPYGALCKNEIKSKANFWGEIYTQRLFMYLCTEGYCCQNLTCDTYNQCANNRAGKLCGRCEDGYSEALFSTQCIKNEDCTYAYTFWVIIALYGFLYVLFFVLEEEWQMLLSNIVMWLKHKIHIFRVKYAIFKSNATVSVQKDNDDVGAYMSIFMYYIQIPSLLRVSIIYENERG